MTMRHRGGGHKRKYRLVDFKRKKQGVVAEVLAIEYDPNRSARIALLQYSDGEKAYILAPVGLAVGAKVNAGETADPSIGNALPLKAIPLGTAIHNIEIIPGRGAQMIRSAGSQATLANREGGYALIKLASGEIRRINEECYATIGQVGNTDHMNVSSGKAGRTRWLGRRPHVRGMVMNRHGPVRGGVRHDFTGQRPNIQQQLHVDSAERLPHHRQTEGSRRRHDAGMPRQIGAGGGDQRGRPAPDRLGRTEPHGRRQGAGRGVPRFAPFNSTSPTLEWRAVDGKPFAIIQRSLIADNNDTGQGRNPTSKPMLAVTRFRSAGLVTSPISMARRTACQ